MMVTQQEELYRQLEAFGWRKVDDAGLNDQSLDWWVNDVWGLSPFGNENSRSLVLFSYFLLRLAGEAGRPESGFFTASR
jgi:hypothetical protein